MRCAVRVNDKRRRGDPAAFLAAASGPGGVVGCLCQMVAAPRGMAMMSLPLGAAEETGRRWRVSACHGMMTRHRHDIHGTFVKGEAVSRKLEQPARVRLSLGLFADQHSALAYLATEDGHRQPSRTVQDLINKEIERRLGVGWRQQVREWAQEQEGNAE